jgi:hypothetical protein
VKLLITRESGAEDKMTEHQSRRIRKKRMREKKVEKRKRRRRESI